MKQMLVVNLHEIEYLEEILTALAQQQVLDCVVREVEGIASHHRGASMEETVLGSIKNLFQQDRNTNYLIQAVTDEEKIPVISERLKQFRKQDRYACSFWFMPISSYRYHKEI